MLQKQLDAVALIDNCEGQLVVGNPVDLHDPGPSTRRTQGWRARGRVAGRDEDGVYATVEEQVESARFPFGFVAAVDEKHREVVLTGRPFYGLHEQRKERVDDVGDHESDRAGLLGSQRTGDGVGAERQRIGCLPDAFSDIGTYRSST